MGVAGLIGFTLMSNKSEMEEQAVLAQEKNETVSVVAVPVAKAAIKNNFSSTGNFISFREITIASLVAGKVHHINVSQGDDIAEGQLIVKLDTDLIEADLLAADASLAKTKRDLDRYEELAPRGGVTPQQVDEVRLAYKNAESKVATVKKQLSNANIKAPFNGTVNARYVEPGSFLAAGGKIIELVDVSSLKMTVAVSEAEVLKLKKGQSVNVSADVLSDVVFNGKVIFIGVKADNSLRYPVEILVKNSSTKTLKAGMYGTAEFTFSDSREALVIPRDAIAGSLKEPKVYNILNGKAVLKGITIGSIGDFGVEVLKGLEAGDQVITDGQINLSDGSIVTVTSR